MTSRARRRRASFIGLAVALGLSAARADSPPARAPDSAANKSGDDATSPEAAAKARDHFKHARELYQAGAYRDALTELEAAHALDPKAKDLVFNLGVVNEKLGNIEDALKYFHLYEQLDLDSTERTRGDAYIKRLEGAKREIAARSTGTPLPPTPPPPPPPEPPPPKGRMDAATITALVFGGLGFAWGGAWGIKALADQPSSFVTGKDGTLATYRNEQASAHSEAILSDVGFGVGLAATALAAYLYFSRAKVQSSSQTGKAAVGGVPTTRGGVFVLRGTF